MNTITILDGSGRQMSPELIHQAWAPARQSRNIVHELLDGTIATALVAAAPRKGRLQLYFVDEGSAATCVNLHAAPASFSLVSDESSTVSMTYVIADRGSATYQLDPETRHLWLVYVDFQEIVP